MDAAHRRNSAVSSNPTLVVPHRWWQWDLYPPSVDVHRRVRAVQCDLRRLTATAPDRRSVRRKDGKHAQQAKDTSSEITKPDICFPASMPCVALRPSDPQNILEPDWSH